MRKIELIIGQLKRSDKTIAWKILILEIGLEKVNESKKLRNRTPKV